jgi:hypothetical protein
LLYSPTLCVFPRPTASVVFADFVPLTVAGQRWFYTSFPGHRPLPWQPDFRHLKLLGHYTMRRAPALSMQIHGGLLWRYQSLGVSGLQRRDADRNFKRHFCWHLGSAASGAPQRCSPALRSPGLGTHAPSAGRLHHAAPRSQSWSGTALLVLGLATWCAVCRRGASAGFPRGAGWPAARGLGGSAGGAPKDPKSALQALDQRFTASAAACLHQVLLTAIARVITAEPVAIPLLDARPTGISIPLRLC